LNSSGPKQPTFWEAWSDFFRRSNFFGGCNSSFIAKFFKDC